MIRYLFHIIDENEILQPGKLNTGDPRREKRSAAFSTMCITRAMWALVTPAYGRVMKPLGGP